MDDTVMRHSGPAFTCLRTVVCDLLNIRLPIIQAPMAGGWTTPELVAAVSNAGGLGMLAATRLTVDELRAAIAATRRHTDRPFGVNFLLAGPEPLSQDIAQMQRFLDQFRLPLGLCRGRTDLALPASQLQPQLALALEVRVPVISFAMGDPGPLVEQVRSVGALVMAMVTTVAEARVVEARGVDIVIAQGAEAGGHRSTFQSGETEEVPLIGTLALVPQIVDAVSVPVVASGGIMDGRGLVAALALGAGGVQLGTRFLLSRESGAFRAYRDRLLAAEETDTVITRVFTGRPARAVRNRLIEEFRQAGLEPLSWPYQGLAANDIYRAAVERDDADWIPLLAGQGLRLGKEGQPAGDIVQEIARQAEAVMAGLVSGGTPTLVQDSS